jgi:hypothetical protein
LIGIAAAVAAVLVAVVVFAVSRAGSGAGPESVPQPPAAASPPAATGSVSTSAPAAPPPVGVAPSVATATVAYRPVEGPQFAARRLGTAPTIDGKGDDWPAMSPIVTDYVIAGDTATVKGLWTIGWDSENLYLLVQVVDSEVTTTNAQNPARLFQGDAVTLQFGSSGANADGLNLSPGDVSVSVGPNGGGGSVVAGTIGSGKTFDVDAGRSVPGVKAATVTTSTGYVVEAALPWSVIRLPEAGGPATMAAGTQFGANLITDDADPAPGSKTGIRSRVSNNRYVADHTAGDGGYRRYWGLLTLGS